SDRSLSSLLPTWRRILLRNSRTSISVTNEILANTTRTSGLPRRRSISLLSQSSTDIMSTLPRLSRPSTKDPISYVRTNGQLQRSMNSSTSSVGTLCPKQRQQNWRTVTYY
ncbi:hypothetical protein DFQ29_004043, partial [Apophysomyces sp. BC1021]